MDAEMRKRLEEAAYKIKCDIVDESPQEIYCNAIEKGAMRGIELGFKEAIEVAKEWIGNICYKVGFSNETASKCVESFETDMNKLWEEK